MELVKAGKVHNLQQVQKNHFMQKVGDWSIPRELIGVDRYLKNVNSLSVSQEKNDLYLLHNARHLQCNTTDSEQTTVNYILYSTFSVYEHDNTTP
jgi:hypothetical protein